MLQSWRVNGVSRSQTEHFLMQLMKYLSTTATVKSAGATCEQTVGDIAVSSPKVVRSIRHPTASCLYSTNSKATGEKTLYNVLPTELHGISPMVGLEPTTLGMTGEVSLIYGTCLKCFKIARRQAKRRFWRCSTNWATWNFSHGRNRTGDTRLPTRSKSYLRHLLKILAKLQAKRPTIDRSNQENRLFPDDEYNHEGFLSYGICYFLWGNMRRGFYELHQQTGGGNRTRASGTGIRRSNHLEVFLYYGIHIIL